MHSVKFTRLRFAQMDTLLCNDAQARVFELGIDFASQVATGCIGFDD